MKIQKDYWRLEDVEEISIYDANEKDFFNHMEMEFELETVQFQKLMKSIDTDIGIFLPYNGGEDFIIQILGFSILERCNIEQSDVEGRLLSKLSPIFHQLLYESLLSVYKTHRSKKLRFFYYNHNKLTRFSNVKLIYEDERIFLISNHRDMGDDSLYVEEEAPEEDKANLLEYFSHTGSYYQVNGKYSWTKGIYNIIDRPRDETDEFYNIVFDLVIPEDKAVVERIFKLMDSGKSNYDALIRIKTHEGILKQLEINLYANFDEEGNLVASYGLIKDMGHDSNENITRPVDFLLNGFKNSKKLALLIEPLNDKHYEFSKSYYDIVGVDKENYVHGRSIIENIVEDDVRLNLGKLLNREIVEFDETFTYNVNGNPLNQKIFELHIEIFDYGQGVHSIGFMTDITEEKNKQDELKEAYEHQTILIKEVHHRVKNNLQVLNSFLNLERRAYKDNPEMILDHMQSRLSSLAILHEKTYNTADFKNINLKNYIEDQDAQLRNLVGVRDGIEFESEVDGDLNLSIEIITPLLLLIDELTMNAIKHAFPDKSKPDKVISKLIRVIDDSSAELILKDNGVGIEYSSLKKNLGCEIIKSLTKQLDGHIELLDVGVGTVYKLIFPIKIEHTISG